MNSETDERSLAALGPGVGSKAERIKLESGGLRGSLPDELQQATTRFSEPAAQLLKFHGVYQQEDRDQRAARKSAGVEKAYQFMVRTRIPGGVLTADQYLAQDDIAGRFANGTLRVTTRQGLQLHGVLKGNLHAAIHDINVALLSTLAACGDVNRNVMTCPAPSTGAGHALLAELAHQTAMHLAPKTPAYHDIWVDGEKIENEAPAEVVEPIYGRTYLPRKFKIAFAAAGDNCVDIYTQDIGLIGHFSSDDQLEGFTVLVGGGLGMTHGMSETYPRLATPLAWVEPQDVISVVEVIVTIQRDYGDRKNRKHARMKYLVEERGIEWFRAETERRLGRTLADPRPVTWGAYTDHLGWHQHEGGHAYLGLHIDNGRIQDLPNVLTRTALREVISRFRPGIRLTAQQNMLLTDIAAEDRAAIEAIFKQYGVSVVPEERGTVRRHALACPALPTCGQALSDAERIMPDVLAELEQILKDIGMQDVPLSVRMTGCPNGCARPYMGDIGFAARTRDVYNVYVGGDWANTRLNTLYAESAPVDQLASLLKPALTQWRDRRLADESFGDYAYRVGIEALKAGSEGVALT